MPGAFDTTIAARLTSAPRLENLPQRTNPSRFLDPDTGAPLPLEGMAERIKRRLSEIDRMSVALMLDLFFVHANWTGLYSRTDSFSSYIKHELGLSRSYAYGILKAAHALITYAEQRSGNAENVISFIEDIGESVSQVGIKRLIEVAQVKEKNLRTELFDQIANGVIPDIPTRPSAARAQNPVVDVMLTGDTVYAGETRVCTLHNSDDPLAKDIIAAVRRHYTRHPHVPNREWKSP